MVKVPFGLNHPVWVTQPRVDPQRHLHRHRVPGDGSMRDLEVLIGRIASTQLDRRFPLWELHYCEGLADGRVAVVGKMHHALADGAAANALLGNVTDVRTAEVPPPPDDVYESTDQVPGRLWLMRRALLDAVAAGLLAARAAACAPSAGLLAAAPLPPASTAARCPSRCSTRRAPPSTGR